MTPYVLAFWLMFFANAANSLVAETWASPPAADTQPQPGRDYVLGPGDQITLVVPGLENEFTGKTFRIDGSGSVSLPLLGRIDAAGLTAATLEDRIQSKLEPILKDPHPVVTLQTFGSQPVSVLGAVKNPGIVQLQGRKTLFEVLSMAGGLLPEAGYIVQITRPLQNGAIPLSTAQVDRSSHFSTASVKLRDIINVPNASQNIQILPGDTVSVPTAGVVYAVGSVGKPGGYTLKENESLSALQVVALAEGLQATAAASKARILRTVPGSASRVEIPVNLGRLLAGKSADVPLHPSDILFVPSSKAKKAGLRALDAIVNAATYSSIYAGH